MSRRRAAVVAAGAAFTATRHVLEDPRLAARAPTVANFRGRPVSLRGGPAAAAGIFAGGLTGAVAAPTSGLPSLALAVSSGAAAAAGWYDDTRADRTRQAKGLRGHLGALARGTVTTGAVKVAVLGAGGYASGRLLGAGRTNALLRGALIAGTANLVNLLDLRPGRAAKATVMCGSLVALAGGAGAPVAGAAVGAALGGLSADLAEVTMLGDTGANALGAALGVALAASRFAVVRLAALAVVTGLTLASERRSFSAVIDRTPHLHRIDAWGRRADAQ
ncbi:MAG: hypothetical protein QOH99_596 [Frankiaceae bacterium]|nr:hypothetical protein [Frankiaceae bacterium]